MACCRLSWSSTISNDRLYSCLDWVAYDSSLYPFHHKIAVHLDDIYWERIDWFFYWLEYLLCVCKWLHVFI